MLLPSFQRFSRKESFCVHKPRSTLSPRSYQPTLSQTRAQIFVGARVWVEMCNWIRQLPFFWRHGVVVKWQVWVLSVANLKWFWAVALVSKMLSDSLGPFMGVLARLSIIFLGVNKNPFLTQGCSQCWLPLAHSAAVPLLLTIVFKSQYFTISFLKPSWIFLSSGQDLVHCHFSLDFSHLLYLNSLADLGKIDFPW